MRGALIAVLALSIAAGASASPAESPAPYGLCLKLAKTTVAMVACNQEQYERVDGQLNAVYGLLLETPGIDRKLLDRAEARWIAFRDADCELVALPVRGGTLASVVSGGCLIDRTEERVKHLRTLQRQLGKAPLGTITSFRTPSKNIGCIYYEGSLRCDIGGGVKPLPPRPASCELDFGQGYSLGRTGRASVVCAGDTALIPDARALRYGTSWRMHGFHCTSKTTGLRCTNTDGRGFFLSRERSFTY